MLNLRILVGSTNGLQKPRPGYGFILSLGGNSGWEHSCPCVAPEAVGSGPKCFWMQTGRCFPLGLLALEISVGGNPYGGLIQDTHHANLSRCQPGWVGAIILVFRDPQKDRTYIVLQYFTNMLRGFHSISLVLLVDYYTFTERQSARAARAASHGSKPRRGRDNWEHKLEIRMIIRMHCG